MPMHEKAKNRILGKLKTATWRDHADDVLDEFNDATLRATEWDADQWGFDPDRWMESERVELASRGGAFWPKEVI